MSKEQADPKSDLLSGMLGFVIKPVPAEDPGKPKKPPCDCGCNTFWQSIAGGIHCSRCDGFPNTEAEIIRGWLVETDSAGNRTLVDVGPLPGPKEPAEAEVETKDPNDLDHLLRPGERFLTQEEQTDFDRSMKRAAKWNARVFSKPPRGGR